MAVIDRIDVAKRLKIEPDPELTGLMERVLRPVTDYYFQTKIVGLENLPEDGGLLVSNHGLYGYDALIFIAKLFQMTGRTARTLVDHNFFRIPLISHVMALFGFVDGNRDNAVNLLKDGELVLVFPGGAREALWKGLDKLYQLQWNDTFGFIKVAIQSGRPLVPVVGIGPDDAFYIVAESEQLSQGPMGRLVESVFGNSKYIPSLALGPAFLPLPMPVPFTYYIGKPTYLNCPPEAAQDRKQLHNIKRNFKKKMERLIQKGLSARACGKD